MSNFYGATFRTLEVIVFFVFFLTLYCHIDNSACFACDGSQKRIVENVDWQHEDTEIFKSNYTTIIEECHKNIQALNSNLILEFDEIEVKQTPENSEFAEKKVFYARIPGSELYVGEYFPKTKLNTNEKPSDRLLKSLGFNVMCYNPSYSFVLNKKHENKDFKLSRYQTNDETTALDINKAIKKLSMSSICIDEVNFAPLLKSKRLILRTVESANDPEGNKMFVKLYFSPNTQDKFSTGDEATHGNNAAHRQFSVTDINITLLPQNLWAIKEYKMKGLTSSGALTSWSGELSYNRQNKESIIPNKFVLERFLSLSPSDQPRLVQSQSFDVTAVKKPEHEKIDFSLERFGLKQPTVSLKKNNIIYANILLLSISAISIFFLFLLHRKKQR